MKGSDLDVSPRKAFLEDDFSSFPAAHPLLLQSSDVEVVGLSATSGNTWRATAMAYARRILEITGHPEVPVLPGAEFPLLNSEQESERWEALYGKLVWKGAWSRGWNEETLQSHSGYHTPDEVPDLPVGNPTVVQAGEEHAALALLRLTRAFPGEISIVATGPLTTLASAIALDAGFPERAKELVYMGGSLNPVRVGESRSAHEFAREFVNSPRREFNIRWDPEAARMVMRAPWRSVTMVPVDPTTATECTPELLRRITAGGTTIGRALAWHKLGMPLWDEVATALWLERGIVTEAEDLFVDVNIDHGHGYGDIVSWSPGYQPGLGERLQHVVRRIDVTAFEDLLVDRLSAPQPAAVGLPVPGAPTATY